MTIELAYNIPGGDLSQGVKVAYKLIGSPTYTLPSTIYYSSPIILSLPDGNYEGYVYAVCFIDYTQGDYWSTPLLENTLQIEAVALGEDINMQVQVYGGLNVNNQNDNLLTIAPVISPTESETHVYDTSFPEKVYFQATPTSPYLSGYIISKIDGVEINRVRIENGVNRDGLQVPFDGTPKNVKLEILQTYWLPEDYVCEKDVVFSLVREIQPLVSPANSAYDDINQMAYVFDRDRSAGNIGWFNPVTITTPGGITWSSAVGQSLMASSNIDLVRRKIFCQGANSG